jgi:hypothetical protein
MGSVRKNHLARLKVGLLEMTVMLVGEADLVGLVSSFVANFTNTCHRGISL